MERLSLVLLLTPGPRWRNPSHSRCDDAFARFARQNARAQTLLLAGVLQAASHANPKLELASCKILAGLNTQFVACNSLTAITAAAGSNNSPYLLGMRSYILVAAVAASGQLVDGAAVTWYEPADGVPLSGLESSQACESRGQRLCYYDELCPSGEDTAPVGMPSSHSDWMPFLSTTYGRRWMTGGCQVHEEVYDEGCGEWGCNTGSPCANECCDHGWCTTPGADGCDSASGSFNGYTGSCKGSYACCSEDETGYENACREWGYPKAGEWNVDEDCCAGKKQMACPDGKSPSAPSFNSKN